MTEVNPGGDRQKIRVKTRISGRRGGKRPPRLARWQVAVVLLLASAAGIILGVLLARGISRMIQVRRQQYEIDQSRAVLISEIYSPASSSPSGRPSGSPGR